MARTRRRKQTNRQARQEKSEREFYERNPAPQEPRQLTPEQEQEVIEKGIELTELLNAEKQRTQTFSVQDGVTDDPGANSTSGYVWWTGGKLDQYIPVAEYGTTERQHNLQEFALIAPLIQVAVSAVTKKMQSLQWTLEGGRNLVKKWQEFLLNVSNSRGWDYFIGKWIRAYLESDNGGIVEVIREAPSWAVNDENQLTERGIAAIERGADSTWKIVDLRVMDPKQITTTASKEFPLIYTNPRTGRRHRLRSYNFLRLLDMPSQAWEHDNGGMCATSRALHAAQEDRMITRFVMEKLSENPGSGLMFVNADTKRLETALKSADREREARGVLFYKGVIFIPVLNPDGTFGVDFVDFAGLPDGFSRQEYYNILKERVATAFGLDVLELGSIPGERLGSAQQATVAAGKSRGKIFGVITQGIEREFRYKLFPESLNFRFEAQESEERREEAEIQEVLFKNAEIYAGIAGPQMANQYLVDMKAIPPEYLMGEDITGNIILDDTESPRDQEEGQAQPVSEDDMEKWFGPRIKMWKNGKAILLCRPHYHEQEKQVERFVPAQPSGVLPQFDPEISEDDIDRAMQNFNVLFPELAGLLDARVSNA